MVSEERAAEILAENAELREQMETVARDAQETLADNESMAKIFEADDKLAAAMAEIERLRAEVNALKWQLNGAINKGNEAIKTAKAYQRKAEKLEKMLKAAGIAE
jgi:seryl-tRNA synthetase